MKLMTIVMNFLDKQYIRKLLKCFCKLVAGCDKLIIAIYLNSFYNKT